MSRRNARRYALQRLYQWEMNGYADPEKETDEVVYCLERKGEDGWRDDELHEAVLTREQDLALARHLISTVKARKEELDQRISRHLKKWSLKQINVVDKNLLRMALAEYEYPQDGDRTDRAVIFDEAVELAREFGGDNSSRFVNGILAAAVKELLSGKEKENKPEPSGDNKTGTARDDG